MFCEWCFQVYEGSSTSFRATQLLPGLHYKCHVQAGNSQGLSPPSAPSLLCLGDESVAEPQRLEVGVSTKTSVSLRWEGSEGAALYEVAMAEAGVGGNGGGGGGTVVRSFL